MATDYKQQIKDIISKDKREILLLTTKASMTGATTGLVLGLMVGYYKGTNKYVSGIIGAVTGAVLTGFLINKK